jgi:ATP-dependent Lon protease
MSEIILSRIDKRLKKVETKISTIKDNYEEMENNLEDMYESINDLKSNNNSYDNSEHNSNTSVSRDSKKNSNKNNNNISKMIDSIISSNNNNNNNNSKSHNIDNLKINTLLFYNRLIQNQPQLSESSIKEHITYFIEQDDLQRDNILTNLENIFKLTDTKQPKLFKILNSNLDAYHKKIALCKLQTIETMQQKDTSASDYFKLSQWLDTFLEIPFNTYKTPSYMDESITTNPYKYLVDSRKHLDTVIYGQQKTKQHIIEILARMIQNPKTLGSVFAIYGEAGTGKTTLIKEGLSHIFGLPFIFISLGGAQDRATLAGSNYVYEGSTCGKIIQSLKQSKCMNPIFYFDELDKTSGTEKGNEIINLLIHLTDYTQNSHFMDDYMDGIAIDLSRATFVFSFNDKDKISPILLDRMEIIKFNSYSNDEKMVIARDFLLPNVVKNVFNDDSIKVIISDENMRKIVIGGPSPQNPLVPAGSFMKKKLGKNRCKISKIMKKVSRRKKEKFLLCNPARKTNGGVRYIKKILERIVSRINLQDLENPARKKQDLENPARKKQDLENPARKKQDLENPARKNRQQDLEKAGFRKSRAQIINIDNLVVDNEIVNDILNN